MLSREFIPKENFVLSCMSAHLASLLVLVIALAGGGVSSAFAQASAGVGFAGPTLPIGREDGLSLRVPTARPRLGVGVRASSTKVDGLSAGEGAGVLLRLRGDHHAIEVEVGREWFDPEDGRSDMRAGGSFYLQLRDTSVLFPYAVVGVGVNRMTLSTEGADRGFTQGFVQAGLGLGLNLGKRVVATIDWRWSARSLSDDTSSGRGRSTVYVPTSETAMEARAAVLLFF